MLFAHTRRGSLKLGPEALAAFRSFEQHAPDALEAGGYLLGRYLRGGFDLVVDQVTVPFPGDERSRYGFSLLDAGHQRALEAAWKASGGTCCYLGHWHTHAEAYPTPSAIDLNDWHRRLRDPAETLPDEARFFVIVGTREIRVWEGNGRTGAITRAA